MRSVMDIGGVCASGGPSVLAVECPEAIGWLLPLSIFAGIGGIGLIAWFGGRVGPGFAAVAALAWPALFLSLGWNFLEYAIASPAGWDLGWLMCGVLFLAMGGIPLVVWLAGARRRSGGRAPARPDSATASAVATPGHTASPRSTRHVDLASMLRQLQGVTMVEAASTTVAEATHPVATDPTPPGLGHQASSGLVDQLERLAQLKEQGALGELEYLQAKQAVIDAAARGESA